MPLRLEPLSEAHLPLMAQIVKDPDVLRFTRVPDPTPDGWVREWYARYEAGRLDRTREAFAGVDDSGEFVGLALAPHIDADAGEMELGYIVAPSARGRGTATAMLEQLTEWAFSQRAAQRLFLLIDCENTASLRVAARAGYIREGMLRSLHVKPGVRADVEMWSRLPTD